MKKTMKTKNRKHHVNEIPIDFELTDIDKMLLFHVMFELGIIPIESIRYDFRRALDQLDPQEAYKTKRKFRKLWRKARIHQTHEKSELRLELFDKENPPTKTMCNARKLVVYKQIWLEHILPLREKLHIPETT